MTLPKNNSHMYPWKQSPHALLMGPLVHHRYEVVVFVALPHINNSPFVLYIAMLW